MKIKIENLQNEMDATITLVDEAVDDLLKMQMELVRAYQQLNIIKNKEEEVMNNYELVYVGYYEEFDCYEQETSWQIRTDKTYEEMAEYVNNLNMHYQMKHNQQSYFYFNRVEVLEGTPDFSFIEQELKEL